MKRKGGHHHSYSEEDIETLAEAYKKNNYKVGWTKFWRDNQGRFGTTKKNAFGQWCGASGLGDVNNDEELKKWIETTKSAGRKTTQRIQPLATLEKKGFHGSNPTTEQNGPNLQPDPKLDEKHLVESSLYAPGLLQNAITKCGFITAPWTAEFGLELVLAWPTHFIQGCKMRFTWFSNTRLTIHSLQKPINSGICQRVLALIGHKLNHDDMSKVFSVPIETTNYIDFPWRMNDQVLEIIDDKDVFGIKIFKAIDHMSQEVSTYYAEAEEDAEEEDDDDDEEELSEEEEKEVHPKKKTKESHENIGDAKSPPESVQPVVGENPSESTK